MALFIGRIAREATPKDLENLFGKYGKMTRCDLKKGYGFVTFEDERDADDAMKELQGYKLFGLRINIEFTKESKKYSGPSRRSPKRRYSPYGRSRRNRYSRSPRRRSRSPYERRRRSPYERKRSRSRSPYERRERRSSVDKKDRRASKSPSPANKHNGASPPAKQSPNINNNKPNTPDLNKGTPPSESA